MAPATACAPASCKEMQYMSSTLPASQQAWLLPLLAPVPPAKQCDSCKARHQQANKHDSGTYSPLGAALMHYTQGTVILLERHRHTVMHVKYNTSKLSKPTCMTQIRTASLAQHRGFRWKLLFSYFSSTGMRSRLIHVC